MVFLEDAALTRAAQAGEVTALGLLLERRRAGMRAVALSILGPGPDADDVLQDAALTALRRIGDVRDPGAVGAWPPPGTSARHWAASRPGRRAAGSRSCSAPSASPR